MDIGLYETLNGGDMSVQNGDLWATMSLWNQIYLGLFGGNVEETTTDRTGKGEQRKDFWGNQFLESEPDEFLNSTTEKILNTTALNSSGRIKIEQAVKNDLSFLQKLGTLDVSVSIYGIDKVLIEIGLTEPNEIEDKRFRLLWDGTRSTDIQGSESDKTGGIISQLWILRNGIWDDFGAWFDNEYWKDI